MSSGNKTALITGSGQNIGRGIANQLALAGFNIIVNGSRNQEAAEAVAAEVRAHGVEALVAMGMLALKPKPKQSPAPDWIILAGLMCWSIMQQFALTNHF